MSRLSVVIGSFTALAIVWIGHALVDVMIGFWSVYKTLAHLDLAIAGLIAGLCPFIGEGMQVFFGSLGDRGYRKALLIFGLAACSASSLLAYSQNYFLLFCIYLVTCIGSGAFHPTAASITSGLTKKRKGLFVTIFASGGALGLAFSHIIFTTWHNHFNGQTLILSLPIFLLIGYILLIKIPSAPHQASPQTKRVGFSSMKELFQNKELVFLWITQVCNQSVYWALIFLLPDALLSKGYEPWICFGGGHLFFILGGAVMMVPGGYLSDLYSAKKVLFFAAMLGMVTFYTFLLSPLLPNFWLLLLLFILGAFLGVSNPVAVAFGHKLMPSRTGLVGAFLMGLVWCISESLGPGGGGLLTKCFVENPIVKALSCFGALFILGMTMAQLLPEKATGDSQVEAAT